MIKDTLDCRAAKWKKRRESEGPKHMAEIRQEVEQKRKNEEARRILDIKHNRNSGRNARPRGSMGVGTVAKVAEDGGWTSVPGGNKKGMEVNRKQLRGLRGSTDGDGPPTLGPRKGK